MRCPSSPFALLLACGAEPAPAAVVYAESLSQAMGRPEETALACGRIEAPDLREDCVLAGAERLAASDAPAAAVLCAGLSAGLTQDECWFQVAEQSTDPAWCARAGRFAEDCAMHLWTQVLLRDLPKGLAPGEVEAAVEPLLAAQGFEEGDGRPWIAVYRMVHGGRRPVDRPGCDRAPRPELVRLCRDAALDLMNDLLNHARDTGTFPCEEGPLPALLSHVPDPEIDALILRRRGEDLCPG